MKTKYQAGDIVCTMRDAETVDMYSLVMKIELMENDYLYTFYDLGVNAYAYLLARYIDNNPRIKKVA